MRILITGAAGFLGRKLTDALIRHGISFKDGARESAVEELVLWDQIEFSAPTEGTAAVETVVGDLLDSESLNRAADRPLDLVFHLAAVVSAQAEAEFDLGMAVNLDGTRRLLELLRGRGTVPRFVTTSSVAVFGGDLPPLVPDTQAPTPRSTYGTTKAMVELLVADYSRKGYVDGRVVRLPTISVRPGKPNLAASSFASSIIREPLNDLDAVCPVGPDTPIWLMSPRCAIANLVLAAALSPDILGDDRVISLPGVTTTPKKMTEALDRVAGTNKSKYVRWDLDTGIAAIVASWPGAFQAERALALGFQADADMDAIVQAYVDDDL